MPCSTPKREFQKRRVTSRQPSVPNTAKKQVGKFYRPRNHETPFFKVVHDYFDEFERVYPERFEAKYGYWRPVIRSSINKFLKCGDLKEGLSASLLLRKVFRFSAVP